MICDENYVYEIKNNTFTYSSLYGKISHIPNDPDIFDEESYHLNNERIKKKLKSEHNLSEDQISKLFFQNSIKDYDTLEKSYRLRSSYSLTNSDLNILQEDPANESYEQTQFFSGESDIEPE
jgi:Zn-finger domain-containing protein